MKRDTEEVNKSVRKVHYGVEDVPAPHLCFLFGLQPSFGISETNCTIRNNIRDFATVVIRIFTQAALCIGSTLSMPYILASVLCAEGRDDVRSQLLGITMFMCGIATLLQTTIGIRLPIIQGGSHTFVAPIVAMMLLDKWKCPEEGIVDNQINGTGANTSDVWKAPMREIQGNLMLASLVQVLVGGSGLAGFILRFIGPLTIAPTIALIGFSLTGVVESFCEYHWGIAFMTAALLVIFSVTLHNVTLPFPVYTRDKGCHRLNFHFFGLLSVLLALGLSWLFCLILTETNVFTNNSTMLSYNARTDSKGNILSSTSWFDFPLPVPFGTPTVSAAGFVGMLAATLSSIIESIGDYLAAARISEAPPPPQHALNRGIAIEGFSSVISGMMGAGHGTTSYSSNIGEIAITRVASRRAFQVAALILIFCGVFGKVGAFLASIPDPVIGGTLIVNLGLVIAVGLSSLQFCDMSSLRNLTIVAVSFMMGMMIPNWLKKNSNAIDSGSSEFDQVVRVLGGTASFVGGFLGFLLDNLLPGTDEERGIKKWRVQSESDEADVSSVTIYNIPFVTKILEKIKLCSYIPMSPTFATCCGSGSSDLESYVYEQELTLDEGVSHTIEKAKPIDVTDSDGIHLYPNTQL